MLFNKKKKEDKEKLKLQKQEAKVKSDEYQRQIQEEEERIKAKAPVLQKALVEEAPPEKGFFERLKKGMAKTRHLLTGGLLELSGDQAVDDDFLEDLEETLLAADLGVTTCMQILEKIDRMVDNLDLTTQTQVIQKVQEIIGKILDKGAPQLPVNQNGNPTVYMFVGVNGVGKTTSIGKLAAKLKSEGKKVLVAAGDTFRAAAIEQLEEWCKRAGVDILKKAINTDPSATMYEAAAKAKDEGYDVLLCDTSGRLHTKKHLMDELEKMQRTLRKIIPTAPHAAILVLDANTGQNAIIQTKEFHELVKLDGLIVTKLDGTAKGGVIIGIVNEFDLPVYYVGVGEKVEDLQAFDPRLYAQGLFEG